MATLIPPVIADYRFEGEQEVARRLQEDTATRFWIALHSLDIAAHRSQVAGECDFVVIVPEMGVLCLEVKGCRSLKVDGGQWYYGASANPDKRGPFKQASEAMYSIRNYLMQKQPDLHGVVFAFGVIFPFINFRISSPEWHAWQVIDAAALSSRPLQQLCSTILIQAQKAVHQRVSGNYAGTVEKAPDIKQCHRIAEVLRPRFEFYESPVARREHLDAKLKRYTREQFTALDTMQANARVIFNGPAGTGKTLLAVEAARRAGMRGETTLLVCFNKNAAQWIKDQFAECDQPQIHISTLHAHMLRVAGIKPPDAVSAEFWSNTLPETAAEKLLDDEQNPAFDFLVIDEAQDILRTEYLDFLDLCLKDGLQKGRWKMFGDFVYQQIYPTADMQIEEVLRTGLLNAPVYSLSVNCRNTPRIAAYAPLLGGLTPDYSSILRPDDHIKPEILFVSSPAGQTDMLSRQIDRFRFTEKFKGDEIVILSPLAENCCAAQLSVPWKDRVRPFVLDAKGGHIRYLTIHAFKGLEAPVVIVTDITKIRDAEAMNLLYVAVTRALSRLVVILQESARDDLLNILGVQNNETITAH